MASRGDAEFGWWRLIAAFYGDWVNVRPLGAALVVALMVVGTLGFEDKPLEGVLLAGELFELASPYVENGPLIDVKGLAPGPVIECPSTGNPIRVSRGLSNRSFEFPE